MGNWGSVPINIASSPPGPAAPSTFIIGVDSQPTSSFTKWQGRSVNTLVRVPSGHDADEWTTAAQATNFMMIRRPRAGTADDGTVPNLIAWSLSDEPDLGGTPAATVVSDGDALRARNSRPVFLNFAGGAVLDHQGTTDHQYYQTASGGGDWICNDFYPVTGWNRPDWIPEVGEAVDILRDISPNKPQFAYIECSDQNQPNLAHRAATPGEMRAQIWLAVLAGVKGIIYFPIRLSFGGEPFSFDGVEAAGLLPEMLAQNADLNFLGPVLLTERNPAGVSATAASVSIDMGWRISEDNGDKYFIALNKTDATVTNTTITLTGIGDATSAMVYGENRYVPIENGVITDSFAPYEKHIYIVTDPDNPSHGEFVNSMNTGVLAYYDSTLGRRLEYSDLTPSSGVTSSFDGQVIEKLDITGRVTVAHNNVIVRACRITSASTTQLGGLAYAGSYTPASRAVGATVEYVELNGKGDGFEGTEHTAVNLGNSTGSFLYIHDFRGGVRLNTGDHYSFTFVENVYRFPGSHNTSMSSHAGDDILVYRCNLQDGTSSALSLYSEFGPITNVLIQDNLFNVQTANYCTIGGYGATDAFADQSNHLRYIGNKFGTKYHALCGTSGPSRAFDITKDGNEWTNNTWQSTGVLVGFVDNPGGTGQVSQLAIDPSGAVSSPTVVLDASDAVEGTGLLAVVTCRDTDTVASAPAGWTLVDSVDDGGTGGGGQPNAFFYYKIATADEDVYTWTFDNTTYGSGALVQVDGIDPGNFIANHTIKIENSVNAHSLNTVTATNNNSIMVAMVAIAYGGYTNQFNFPIDYEFTSDAGGNGTSTGRRSAVAVGFKIQENAGASGTPTFSQQNGNVVSWVSCHIACNPTL